MIGSRACLRIRPMRPEPGLKVVDGGGVGEAPPPSDLARSITVVGARGGQGTSTVACALAILASHRSPTTLVTSEARATAAILGVAEVSEQTQVAPGLSLSLCDRSTNRL